MRNRAVINEIMTVRFAIRYVETSNFVDECIFVLPHLPYLLVLSTTFGLGILAQIPVEL